ncbi:MAG: ammonia-forming cytochrome c nitrite reductase subunit c552 [Actinomycetaceae bacterium]|nr:ammonia-forming cytochrome c nitrite reductase subunit c552 [Actinomycetaceae bacterium]
MNDETTKEATKQPARRRGGVTQVVLLLVVAVAAAFVTWLLLDITQNKEQSAHPWTAVVEIDDSTYDPAVWGQNWPAQYEGFKATAEMDPENKVPNDDPSVPEDTREFKTKSKLALEPRLVSIWKGYAFSVEYNEPRGHEYMLEDQKFVKRMTDFDQPGACLNCHVSLPQVLDSLNPEDSADAWAQMNKLPYSEAVQHAGGPIACIDCHNPETMELRVSRPAFMEGIKAAKAAEGIKDFDVNRDATNEEMRTYVCAQCHVEYYFKGEEKTLTFPWTKGLTVTDAIDYYDEAGFSDFTHADTGAEVIKAQHPDFETWSQGIHAENGVTCADCHMPYKRDGAGKISDHQVQTPMIDDAQINASCLTCHHSSEAEMRGRVDEIQQRWSDARDVAFTAVQDLIDDIVEQREAGTVSDENLAKAYDFQRKAQFIVDYSVSENSRGFHAPQYSVSILNMATDYARSGQLALRGIDVDTQRTADSYDIQPVPRPGAKN